MVKELAENYATELGHWPDIIATGGDAAALFEGLGARPRDRAGPDAVRHRAGVHEPPHQARDVSQRSVRGFAMFGPANSCDWNECGACTSNVESA